MNRIKSIVLYFGLLLALCVVPYVFFEGYNLIISTAIVVTSWSVLYLYIEKILLFQLDAREVIDTDQQELFQFLKNQSYTSSEKTPKVYLYSGSGLSCFVFESRNNWNIIIDRKLLNLIEVDQLESFVEFLFKYKKTGKVWLNTKAIGICCILFNFINWLLISLLRFNPKSNSYKVFSMTMLIFLRPFWSIVESIAKKRHPIKVNKKIESIYLQSLSKDEHFYDYLLGHVDNQKTVKKQIINYIEGFSVIRNCEFN
jgi:hypothetical protein